MQLHFRYLTNYTFLAEDQPDFTPSDAISLGLLVTGTAWFGDVWRAAYRSVCAGLDLPDPDRALLWLGETTIEATGAGLLKRASLHQLVRLRRRMQEYCDEWGDVIEGDIWGQRHGPPALRAQLADAQSWYRESLSLLLNGLATFDPAICAHLGWPVERAVPFSVLRQQHGFPDTDYDP